MRSQESIVNGSLWTLKSILDSGDIVPQTDLGRAIASAMMLVGWGILAVPTGIITAEMTAQHYDSKSDRRSCVECGARGHDSNAHYCRQCGTPLASEPKS